MQEFNWRRTLGHTNEGRMKGDLSTYREGKVYLSPEQTYNHNNIVIILNKVCSLGLSRLEANTHIVCFKLSTRLREAKSFRRPRNGG